MYKIVLVLIFFNCGTKWVLHSLMALCDKLNFLVSFKIFQEE